MGDNTHEIVPQYIRYAILSNATMSRIFGNLNRQHSFENIINTQF